MPATERQRLVAHLKQRLPGVVEQEPDKWGEHGMQPLEAVPAPDAPLAGILPDALLQANLDYWIDSQLPDGSWPVPWSWDFIDASAWAEAERDWKGVILVNRLRTLRAFGR